MIEPKSYPRTPNNYLQYAYFEVRRWSNVESEVKMMGLWGTNIVLKLFCHLLVISWGSMFFSKALVSKVNLSKQALLPTDPSPGFLVKWDLERPVVRCGCVWIRPLQAADLNNIYVRDTVAVAAAALMCRHQLAYRRSWCKALRSSVPFDQDGRRPIDETRWWMMTDDWRLMMMIAMMNFGMKLR